MPVKAVRHRLLAAVINGWALAETGIEVMHAVGGDDEDWAFVDGHLETARRTRGMCQVLVPICSPICHRGIPPAG